VDNVKHVIQLCAERGKAHFEQKDKIERLNDKIDSQTKVIAELKNQRDQWETLAAKRSGEMNRRSDMIDIMEKQCDQKDKAIKALKATCDIRQGFIDKGLELSNELRNLLMEKSNEIDGLQKRIKRLEEALGCVVVSCNHLHHRKKHQHKLGEPCPVEGLIRKAKEAKP